MQPSEPRERPILFSGPLVRAILTGAKTQTRRVVKDRREWAQNAIPKLTAFVPSADGDSFAMRVGFGGDPTAGHVGTIWCPYGAPGDRLWVRHAADIFPVYFKPIPGWEGLYAAGTDGVIYRMDRAEPEPLAGSPNSKGYLTVSLSRGQWETHAVHKLVCESFYGPAPFGGAQVRHMDGDQSNNRPENLDWGSQVDNWLDRKAHGGGMGEAHHASKLTRADVEAIRSSSLSQRALAKQYGVSQSTISDARKAKTWAEHAPAARNLPAFKMWRPSIHMPRWASRLLLDVTSVRVERLQAITEEDARAEGVEPVNGHPVRGAVFGCGPSHREGFAQKWIDIYGAESWAASPWVWVVGFKRVEVR